MQLSSYSSQGKRSRQEDRFGCIVNDTGVLLAVADGVGGGPEGDVAATAAINSVTGLPITTPAKQMVQYAHTAVLNPNRRACTLTLVKFLWSKNPVVTFAHAGDSRFWVVRNGEVHQVSTDHSPAGIMYANEMLPESEFDAGEGNRTLLSCCGSNLTLANITIQSGVWKTQPGDLLVLTSDGLHTPQFRKKLRSPRALTMRPEDFVKEAIDEGSTDNCTIILYRV
jgi:protein phosphatase